MRPALLLVVVLAGCASGAARVAHVDAPCVTGIAGGEGVEGMRTTILRPAEGGVVRLSGALVSRIGRLTGALVTVCGTRSAPGAPLDVSSFELREVDGMQAFLGTLRFGDDGAEMDMGEDRPTVPLGDVPAELSARSGGLVWVAGAWEGGRFSVRAYGVVEEG